MSKTLLYIMMFAYLSALSGQELHWEKKVGDFSVEATINPSELSIQDLLHIDLIATFPQSYTLDLDTLRTNILKYAGLSEPPFSLVGEKQSKLPNGGLKLHFTLEPQLTGKQFLSFYNISFISKKSEDKPVEMISNIFEINVTALENPKFQPLITPLLSMKEEYPILMDSKNRIKLNENFSIDEKQRNVALLRQKTLPWNELLAVILFALLAIIIKYQPKRGEEPLQRTQEAARLDASDKGSHALEQLKDQELVQPQHCEEYYLQITNIVRQFIEEKYLIRASIKTTQEFLVEMTQNPQLSESVQALLSEFLIRSDRVKFAEHVPTPVECEEAYKAAETLIKGS